MLKGKEETEMKPERLLGSGWVLGMVLEADLALLLPGHALTLLDLVAHLSAERARPRLVGLELLPDDGEVGFVGGQAQHDEVGCSERQNRTTDGTRTTTGGDL